MDTIRTFGKVFQTLRLPDLMETQRKFYQDFLQTDIPPAERSLDGLEGVFQDAFPIESYDGKTRISYLQYQLSPPRYTPEECRQLRQTYGAPLKVRLRLEGIDREPGEELDPLEEDVYIGEIPLMIGGGEFIVNGAERVIVTQIQRSPGVDFSVDTHSSGKTLHACRIIPERGSWIQVEVTSKDSLVVRIDRSGKIAATTLLRALAARETVASDGTVDKEILLDTDDDILRTFYKTTELELTDDTVGDLEDAVLVAPLADPIRGTLVAHTGTVLTRNVCHEILKRLDTVRQEEERKSGTVPPAVPVKVEVILPLDLHDDLILNTLKEDDSHSHEQALISLYKRLRPGTPANEEKAWEFFKERFFNEKNYSFGSIGRFRLCRKFRLKTPEEMTTTDFSAEEMALTAIDFANICNYILKLRAGQGEIDDIDHLENRRVQTIRDLVASEMRRAMGRMQRNVREQATIKIKNPIKRKALSTKAADSKKHECFSYFFPGHEECRVCALGEECGRARVRLHDLLNAKTISSAVENFFARGELSQVVDQSNPLAQLVHERRLSALGPGGLNRKRAGFDVRDVHTSHYGRVCPVETPEGANIGLIVSLGNFASINGLGFLVTPYYVVKNRKITSEVVYLRADEEREHFIGQADVKVNDKGEILTDRCICRHNEEFEMCDASQISLLDVAPNQLVGVAASLIPFLEHDDANRALMGSNMQRQAVPLVIPDVPLVGTGMEVDVVRNSGMVARAKEAGTVTYADALEIRVSSKQLPEGERTYRLHKFKGLNEGTTLNQTPLVRVGDVVKEGDPLTEGAATRAGHLALGKNVLMAFLSWEGCNFEDSILVSEELIRDDAFTSVHIEEYSVEIRETKVGSEEITRDIPGVSEAALSALDRDGLVTIGTRVKPGDILVGKIAPKAKSEFSSEEKLLRAIFGRAGEDVKNDSLVVSPGTEGYVIDVKRFTRRTPSTDEERKAQKREIDRIEAETRRKIVEEIKMKFARLKTLLGADPVNRRTGKVLRILKDKDYKWFAELQEQVTAADLDFPASKRKQGLAICLEHDRRIAFLESRQEVQVGRLKRGDELRPGVLELVKVYVAVKRKLSVGDKMAGRHGNKGVVSRILPIEDMPFLEDGTSIQMVLNPLGVPSRMNVGQILEVHLGWAATKLGFRAVTPVFDGASEKQVVEILKEAGLPEDGKAVLYDGRTGEAFHETVTVGYMYFLKLHHLVAAKIHARATGPYSLITQQPLGGKARNGGQRFGEMEVWALEAYGAATILQELLTVKSDDVEGRTKIYEAMVKGENAVEPGMPISFDVLCNEIKGLGLNIQLEKSHITE